MHALRCTYTTNSSLVCTTPAWGTSFSAVGADIHIADCTPSCRYINNSANSTHFTFLPVITALAVPSSSANIVGASGGASLVLSGSGLSPDLWFVLMRACGCACVRVRGR
jgi:hypothetical protein